MVVELISGFHGGTVIVVLQTEEEPHSLQQITCTSRALYFISVYATYRLLIKV